MSQCKVPLFPHIPKVWICVKEEGHDDLHYTYTVRNEAIYYQAKDRD